jgi:hypothetical protein
MLVIEAYDIQMTVEEGVPTFRVFNEDGDLEAIRDKEVLKCANEG